MRRTIIALGIIILTGHGTASAQSLPMDGHIPAYLNPSQISAGDRQYAAYEVTVNVPQSSGQVQVRAGFSPGDTSLMVRNFPLGTAQTWADSTWVRPSGGGSLLGLGRHIGLNALYVEVRNGASVLGSGVWTRP